MVVLKEIHSGTAYELVNLIAFSPLEFDGTPIETPFGTAYKFLLLISHYSGEWDIESTTRIPLYLTELQLNKLQSVEA